MKGEHPMYCPFVKKITQPIGHHIRAWRQHRGLTLQRLEERLEREPGEPLISRVSLGRIERGEQPYSQPILEAIAEALQCTPAELLTVDPSKEGEVVDLMRLIRGMDPQRLEMATRMLKAIA